MWHRISGREYSSIWLSDFLTRDLNGLVKDPIVARCLRRQAPGGWLTSNSQDRSIRRHLPRNSVHADIFILPSLSEGAPKVAQEAAACGLPVIAFGFYELPTMIDNQTGFLVWSDAELEARLAQLMGDGALRSALGTRGAAVARDWGWERVAAQWEGRLVELTQRQLGPRRSVA